MERTQIYFTKRQKNFINKESKKWEISYASLMRRVLDSYIEKQQKPEKPTQPPPLPSPPDNEFLKEGDKESRVKKKRNWNVKNIREDSIKRTKKKIKF